MKYLILIVLFITSLIATPALAQRGCGEHDYLAEFLARDFGESLRVMAFDRQGRVVELFASEPDENGRTSWTIARTALVGEGDAQRKLTCVLTDGHEIDFFPPGELPVPAVPGRDG